MVFLDPSVSTNPSHVALAPVLPLTNQPMAFTTPLPTAPKCSAPAHGVTMRRATPFTAKELFDVVQATIDVKLFEAKHGEKGETTAL